MLEMVHSKTKDVAKNLIVAPYYPFVVAGWRFLRFNGPVLGATQKISIKKSVPADWTIKKANVVN